jgi:hypothetical protein
MVMRDVSIVSRKVRRSLGASASLPRRDRDPPARLKKGGSVLGAVKGAAGSIE